MNRQMSLNVEQHRLKCAERHRKRNETFPPRFITDFYFPWTVDNVGYSFHGIDEASGATVPPNHSAWVKFSNTMLTKVVEASLNDYRASYMKSVESYNSAVFSYTKLQSMLQLLGEKERAAYSEKLALFTEKLKAASEMLYDVESQITTVEAVVLFFPSEDDFICRQVIPSAA